MLTQAALAWGPSPLAGLSDPSPSLVMPSSSSAAQTEASGRYTDWRPVNNGQLQLFHAIDRSAGWNVIIALVPQDENRISPTISLQDQLDRVNRFHDLPSLRVVECNRQQNIYQIVMLDEGYQDLGLSLENSNPEEHLETALGVLWCIHTACLRDVYHGFLNTQSILIGRNERLQVRVNFLERYLRDHESVRWTTDQLYQADVRGAIAIVQQIMESMFNLNNVMDFVSGRKLAVLKRLARDKVDEASLETAFDTWCSALGECLPQERNPFLSNWVTPVGSTVLPTPDSEVEEKSGYKTEPKDCPSEQISNSDRTAEISVHVPAARDIQSNQVDSGATLEVGTPLRVQVTAPLREKLVVGSVLGRYTLEKVLGQGGMGIVFRGSEHGTGRIVAIKVLLASGTDNAHAIRRFRKEARILASVQNEFVTELVEVGEDRGYHFIAMEFVDGPNLKEWINTRLPLDETRALQLVRDISRALVQAHAQQIVHRDLKPENILLARKKTLSINEEADLECYSLKLSDFGIARHIEQSVSMEVTRAGTMLGTPWYMSPEQCKGSSEIGPSADIYALGIMLFEMLAGELPYYSEDPMQIAAMHCFDPPPDIQKRNRRVSERTAILLTRMIAKQPKDRPADAAQVLRELENILLGSPSDIEDHPRLPNTNLDRMWSRVFQWDLKSTAMQLWPYVCDTDRLNRAVGLPSVIYRTELDANRGLRKFGSFKIGGMKVEWEEHPFEWIEGKRMGVLREFSSGPFKWFVSSVEFVPLPSGGTRLVHTVKIEPRNTLGKIVSTIEAGWKGGRALDKVYNRIDDYLQNNSSDDPTHDAFESSVKLSRDSLNRIEDRYRKILDMGVEIELATSICDFVKTASPQAIAKIRPLELATMLGMEADSVVDACVVAAHCGLLQLKWDILCPTCRAPASSEPLLARISSHTECEACASEFRSNLGNAIELVFCVHPEIRESDTAKYCVGGPGHSPHVVSQIRMQPGERMEIEVPLEVGDYLIRTTQNIAFQSLRVRADHAPTGLELEVSGFGQLRTIPNARAGIVSLALINDTTRQQLVRLERTIDRNDVVTASAVSTLKRFRECFPEQLFDKNVPVDSEELTLLAVQINNAEQLYRTRGDAEAYRWFQGFFESVEKTVNALKGTIVKTVDEGLIATFIGASNAIQAALEIERSRSEFDQSYETKLGIGVHRGRTLVSTQNGRLDYFGTAPRVAQQLAEYAKDSLVLSDSVFTEPSARELLSLKEVESSTQSITIPSNNNQIIQQIHLNSSRRRNASC